MMYVALIWLIAASGIYYADSRRLSNHIVNGNDVRPVGKYPWQGSLQYRWNNDHTCGVVLMSSTHCITAAHCITKNANSYHVALGLHDQNRRQGRPVNYDVARITEHPDFDYDSVRQGLPWDIATIRLARAVDLSNPYISTIRLAPNDGHSYIGDECYITGWGRLSGTGPRPDILQEARIDVISEDRCSSRYGNRIRDQHICVLDERNGRGACTGDSGGPLSCRRGGSWYVAGVFSWGSASCRTNVSPSVYTRVSYFNRWINQNLN